jgi:23S rRNA (uracil1939-C5)-methyltransferase
LLLTIEKLVYGGEGLARLPADQIGHRKAVFVPFVLEGEKIEVSLLEEKRGYARVRAARILQDSPHRVEPPCLYFQSCGGCHYQHAAYEHQLDTKAAILTENLRRIAKIELDTELVIHSSPAWNYRNRARLKVQSEPEFALGYYKFNSHQLLPVEQCPISSPLINRAMADLWRVGRTHNLPREIQEIELFANAEDTQLLVEIYCAPVITVEAATHIATTVRSVLTQMAGVVVFQGAVGSQAAEPEPVAKLGAGELTYNTRHHAFRVSAGVFFQVNRHLIDELLSVVTQGHSGDLALDLYAGVGLFSVVLSQRFAQVIAVESSPTSYSDLLYNAKPNVGTVHATTDQFLKNRVRKPRPDLVVVDPPRSGLGEVVVRSLGVLGARQVTYVSCDPATLSRDLAGLLNAGYRIQRAHMVDLFPQTFHVESVFDLVRST